MSAEVESPQSRLIAAGFARTAHLWSAPNNGGVMSQEDAIAALDSGGILPATVTLPDSGVRALPDELVERMFTPREQPPWLGELAGLVAAELKPVVRAEVRAAMRAKGGKS